MIHIIKDSLENRVLQSKKDKNGMSIHCDLLFEIQSKNA